MSQSAYAFGAAMMAMMAAPLYGQEDDGEVDQAVESLDTRVTALAETLEGIREGDGDTVEENAGEIEAAIMSAAALSAAADQICRTYSSMTPGFTSLHYVTDDDIAAARNTAIFITQLDAFEMFLFRYRRDTGSEGLSAQGGARSVLPMIGAAAQLVSSLFRSTDTVRGLDGTLTDEAVLANMMIDRPHCLAAIGNEHSRFTVVGDVIATGAEVNNLVMRISSLQEAYAQFTQNIGNPPSDAEKRIIAAYEALMLAMTSSENGASAIGSYLRAADLWDDLRGNPSTAAVLRLQVEKSGGTLLQRRNLWTALGAHSFAITAGIIVSYRISRADGTPLSAGTFYCTTMQTNFKRLHEMGRSQIPANCTRANGAS